MARWYCTNVQMSLLLEEKCCREQRKLSWRPSLCNLLTHLVANRRHGSVFNIREPLKYIQFFWIILGTMFWSNEFGIQSLSYIRNKSTSLMKPILCCHQYYTQLPLDGCWASHFYYWLLRGWQAQILFVDSTHFAEQGDRVQILRLIVSRCWSNPPPLSKGCKRTDTSCFKPNFIEHTLSRTLESQSRNNGYTEHPAGTSVISAFCFLRVLEWYSMREYVLKHTQMTTTFDTKMILHTYICLTSVTRAKLKEKMEFSA